MLPAAHGDRPREHASAACRAVFDEVIGFEFQHPGLMRLHQLSVDAYGAQHGGGDAKPIRLAYSLVGLHLALDLGLTGDEVRAAHQRMGKPDPTWPRFAVPDAVGATTALDVAEAGARRNSVAGHETAVPAWAVDAWTAWAAQREAVAALARRLVPESVSRGR